MEAHTGCAYIGNRTGRGRYGQGTCGHRSGVPAHAGQVLRGRCKVARRWRLLVVAMAAAVGMGSVACSAGPTEAEGLTADGLVPFINMGDYAPGASPQRNFNPFSPNKAVVGYTF